MINNNNDIRALWKIAKEIRLDWKNVYFGAVPYLEAMDELTTIDDMFYMDSGRHIVMYFLSNATTWRGDTARRIKAELKALLNNK